MKGQRLFLRRKNSVCPAHVPIIFAPSLRGANFSQDWKDVFIFCFRYAINELKSPTQCENSEPLLCRSEPLCDFFAMVKEKIIHGKEAFLLVDLLRDAKMLCKNSSVNKTCHLKKYLTEKFGDEISFFTTGRNCVVHASDINPCQYSIATIKGNGLRDDDIIRAFGSMIRRKIAARKAKATQRMSFPYPPDEQRRWPRNNNRKGDNT